MYECKMQNAKCKIASFAQRNLLQLLQRDAENGSQRESLRKRVRDAHARAAQLEKVERRFSSREHVAEFAREVFAIVRVEMQRLEVVAEVHRAQLRRAARELGQRHAERQRAEDPVLLRELAAPEVLFRFSEVLEPHLACLRTRARLD